MTDALASLGTVAAIGWKVLDRFHIGSSIAISPHGLGIAIGYLAGSYVLVFEAKRRGIPEEKSGSMIFWALIGAIVGARFFYVLAHLSDFHNLGQVLAVYNGGISLIGGIFGAVIAGYPIIRRNRFGFLRVMDTAAIGLPLGIVIGRIGDLVIGDHLGKPTSWALAFQYHGGNLSGYDCTSFAGVCRTTLFGGHSQTITKVGATFFGPEGNVLSRGVGVHQTALYDFFSTMLLVLFVLWLSRKPRRTGILFLTFATWYGCGRIVTDFLRVDKTFFGLTGSQWASIGVVLLCLATFVRFALRPERPPGGGPADAEVASGAAGEAEPAPEAG